MAEKPKLTIALNCYKVERFVEEAVAGAFAQTYRPLEIVISDDHSPDTTWEKIVETVMRLGCPALTKDAPWHNPDFCGTAELMFQGGLTVILNRNEQNLGLALHQNRIFELAHGEWIAFQAGDDISTPNRMNAIAEQVATNPDIRCLHCPTEVIDVNGKALLMPDDFKMTARGKGSGLPNILGAGAVYHRDVFWKFGPLGAKVGNEDHVLPLRASLIGTIMWIPNKLVRYRKHGDNDSGCFSSDSITAAKYRLKLIYSYYQELEDLHTFEVQGLGTTRQSVVKYRKLILRDMEIQWVLGHWVLHPQMRGQILRHFLTSPRLWILFANRLMYRVML